MLIFNPRDIGNKLLAIRKTEKPYCSWHMFFWNPFLIDSFGVDRLDFTNRRHHFPSAYIDYCG